MKAATILARAAILFVLGIGVARLIIPKKIVVHVDATSHPVTTRLLTVAGALRSAGIALQPADVVEPSLDTWLQDEMHIAVIRALHVQVEADGSTQRIATPLRDAINILALSGVTLRREDRVLFDGVYLPVDSIIPTNTLTMTLEIRRAVAIRLIDGEKSQEFFSAAPTVGEALAEAGISLLPTDHLQPEPNTALVEPLEVTIIHGKPIFIQADGGIIEMISPAEKVGEALTAAGITLEGEDYSLPATDEPIPPDGRIRVIRVTVEITRTEEAIPFGTQTLMTSQLEIDSSGVLQSGEKGVRVRETRIRYEDGQVVSNETIEQVTVEPKPRIIGFGTNISIRSLDTPTGKVEYWRKVTVYATSYSPCRSGTTKCSYLTANGQQVQKGVIGVPLAWYGAMVGQRVYVSGYGSAVVADTGGMTGYWIDLGFSDDDYVEWHQNTTLYFLTPVPPDNQILWILP